MAETSAAPLPRHHFISRFFALQDRYPQTPAQRTYNNLSTFPMFFAAMIWLLSTFFTWVPALSPEYRQEGVRLSLITWLIFAIDPNLVRKRGHDFGGAQLVLDFHDLVRLHLGSAWIL